MAASVTRLPHQVEQDHLLGSICIAMVDAAHSAVVGSLAFAVMGIGCLALMAPAPCRHWGAP